MADFRTVANQPANLVKRSWWSSWLPWGLVFLLVLSNLGTLLSARVHALGFRALESVLTAAAPVAAERLLARSSTRIVEKQAKLVRRIAARATARVGAHSARSVASIPERVMPLLGTATVVGFAAYDVQTDCATAADMNELLIELGQSQVDAGAICRLADKIPSPSKAWSLAKESATGMQRQAMQLMERLPGASR